MTKKLTSCEQLLEIKLQVLYDIEKQLEKALPKMAKAATDPVLKDGFTAHAKQTKMHSERLETIFKLMNLAPKKLKSEGIRGIVMDAEWVTATTGDDSLRDVMLASSARYAEHYEMAGYLSASQQAEFLGLAEVSELLKQTLDEEEETDKKLQEAMQNNLEAFSSSETQ